MFTDGKIGQQRTTIKHKHSVCNPFSSPSYLARPGCSPISSLLSVHPQIMVGTSDLTGLRNPWRVSISPAPNLIAFRPVRPHPVSYPPLSAIRCPLDMLVVIFDYRTVKYSKCDRMGGPSSIENRDNRMDGSENRNLDLAISNESDYINSTSPVTV